MAEKKYLTHTAAQLDAGIDLVNTHETTKANVDGAYDGLTAGNAEQLISSVAVNDKVPYTFRTAGGSADIGNRMTDKVIGGTFVWNQLIKNGNFADTSEWAALYGGLTVSDNVGTYTMTSASNSARIQQNASLEGGHKYLISYDVKSSRDTLLGVKGNYSGTTELNSSITANAWHRISGILTAPSNATIVYFYCSRQNALQENDTVQYKNVQIYDLTKMFPLAGTTIASYIATLETATAGAGVAWFRKLFPKSFYAYNAGTLMSVKVGSHKTVGFNALKPVSGTTGGMAKLLGGVEYQISGTYISVSYTNIDGDSETITPDADGYFTPTKNGTLYVVGMDESDTCVHIVWDGERDGEWEAYTEHEYALDDSLELYGLPKLDANNVLYYDGDEYTSDGTVKRRFEYRAYQSGDEAEVDAITDGTHTVVKRSTATTETAASFASPQIVDDFGTEEYTDYAVAAGTRDVAIPVGHDSDYQNNLRAKLEMSPDSPDGNGDYIVRQTNGINTYVPLVKELPTAPTTDGTYLLKVVVADGTPTYSWEVQE